MLDSGIESKDIIFVIGGSEDEFESISNGQTIVSYVSYNSFDLTGLIYVANNLQKIEEDHFFLLHDTCLVGKNFKKLSQNFNPSDIIKTVRPGISQNIGMYSRTCIQENIEFLNSLKFYPKNEEELQSVKQVFVVKEDIIFKKYPSYCYINSYIGPDSQFLSVSDLKLIFSDDKYKLYFEALESSKINRQIGYADMLDFYKLQANCSWGDGWKIGI